MKILHEGIAEVESRRQEFAASIESGDRLRYIMAPDEFRYIKEIYIDSQTAHTRQQLDACNLEGCKKGFHDVITKKFNDISWKPATAAKFLCSSHGEGNLMSNKDM